MRFVVYGEPVPQGSKVLSRFGGMFEASPRVGSWRQEIAAVARELYEEPLTGPLKLGCRFSFPRLRSHYGTGRNAGVVKKSAPVWKTSAPDLDKLVRAVGDALTGIVWIDDAQVVELDAAKLYGPLAGVAITIRPASLQPVLVTDVAPPPYRGETVEVT